MQGWWSRLNFNGSGFRARFSKLLSYDSEAGHFPSMASTSAPFDPNFTSSGSAPTKICLSHTINHVVNSALQPFATISQYQPEFFKTAQTNRFPVKWLRCYPQKVITVFCRSFGFRSHAKCKNSFTKQLYNNFTKH